MNELDIEIPLSQHVDELRGVLIRSFLAILIGILTCFYFYQELLSILILTTPVESFALFSPQEGFIAVFKLAFWMGILGTSPYWLFAILRFIKPALRQTEKKSLPAFIILSLMFISSGLLLCLFCTLPVANRYFYQFNSFIGLNLWGFAAYLDYLLLLLFAHGVTFEIGAVLLLLIHLKILSWRALASKRRHFFIVSLIIGALLTPPDIFTQLMVALPLYAFFEVSILYGKTKQY